MRKGFLLLTGLLAALTVLSARSESAQTRLAVVGLDHDHVWGLLEDMPEEPNAELVAIADLNPDLMAKAKPQVPGLSEVLFGLRQDARRGEAGGGLRDHFKRPTP